MLNEKNVHCNLKITFICKLANLPAIARVRPKTARITKENFENHNIKNSKNLRISARCSSKL